jgi:hypothetical protein
MRAFSGGGPAWFSLWRFFVHGHSLGIHIYFVNLPGFGNKCIDTLASDCYILCINTNEQQIARKMTMEAREQRGLLIAAKCRLTKKGNEWKVPSQTYSTGKWYSVNPYAGTCTCLDHQEAGHKCKHIFAVLYTIEREYSEDGMVLTEKESLTVQTTRKTYRQDWRNYNLAQTNEKATSVLEIGGFCESELDL